MPASLFSRSIRSGLTTGVVLLFLILIGVYTTFEPLTVSGMWLTVQGATASEIAAQAPTATNPQFTRIFTALVGLIAGLLAARPARQLGQGILGAVIANGIAGAMVAVFLIVSETLYANDFSVSFVLEKLKEPTIQSLLLEQPAMIGGAIWIGALVVTGALGAMVLSAWRGLRVARRFKSASGRSGIKGSRVRMVLLAIAALFLLIAPPYLGLYWSQVLGSVGLFVLLGLGLNIVVGFAGLLDLGYVGFYAIGAYTIAILTSPDYPFGWGFWAALPLAMAAAALAGALLGIPVLRLRGDYLAIVTLGFGEIIRIIYKFNPLTGGPQGILNVAAPSITIPMVNYTLTFNSSISFWYPIFFACIIVAFVAARLNDSRLGRSWTAMREDEDATEAMGVDTTRIKLLAFGAGAFFAGLGGAIYASRQQHIFPDDFTLLVSINALALIIIGGLGSIPGVIIGSIVLIGLPEVLRPIADYRLLAYAALLVIMMLVRPAGLIPAARQRREFRERDPELENIETA